MMMMEESISDNNKQQQEIGQDNNINNNNNRDHNNEDENETIATDIEDISTLLAKIEDANAGSRPPRKYSEQDNSNPEWFKHKKHFFIFSFSGKPIYSRYGDEVALNTFMATLSAMTSFVESQNDVLRSLVAGKHQFVFLQKNPLCLVCICNTGEPQMMIQQQLEYIHAMVISVLTQTNIKAVFDAKYDLRDLLGGTDKLIDNIIHKVNLDFPILLNSVQCIRLNYNTRNSITNILQNRKSDSIIFSLLLVDNKLVSMVKQKKTQTLKPQDIHIILNYISSSTIKDSESFMPICLPNFNDAGFLHLYICFIYPQVCLLLFSNQVDSFYQLSECKDLIVKDIESENLVDELTKSANTHEYSTSQTEVPNLLHFIYKNRISNYSTHPIFTSPYTSKPEKKRLFRLYQHIYNRANNSLNKPHKYYYYTSQTETIFVLINSSHEIYATFSPLELKKSVFESLNILLQWIKENENVLFLST
ncbi:hypothetical protein CYY_002400 [Polysphondylium violaceum]|uniref:Vacuolar fusion protein MON1 homolog n=1 Tax=Polysphondylium violaceum TaxID=133409 RepID=A0A8J4PZ39_9MYCE|nr:hypothetical protein CYY_002400 [Polysphondylium violaceum]